MKFNDIRFWFLLIVALLAGFAAGYFWFNQGSSGVSDGVAPEPAATAPAKEQIWTCSMHPQIRQNEPGSCPICEMDLIPLGENTSNDPLVLEMTSEAVKLAQVETTVIGGTGNTDKTITLSGKIQADERLSASQVAHVPGRIEQLFVTFTGEQVSKGQKLAVIYSPQLISAQQELIEATKYQDVNNTLLDAARKKLEYWKIPKEQIDEIERTGVIQEVTTVFADASGIVTKRRIAVGDYVGQGEVLFDFVSLDRLWVLFDAYEEDLPAIRVGDRIEFTTPASGSRKFTTNVTFIDPLINPETRAAAVRAEVDNQGNLLKPEMFVRGTLRARSSSSSALTVPRSAVLWTGTRSVVYIEIPDRDVPSFRYQEVELGSRIGDMYVVVSGLDAGDEVVTNGNFTIDAAAQLNNQASMMNRNVMLKGADHSEHLPDYTEVTPEAFKNQLSVVVQGYLGLKDALVDTDAERATTTASTFLDHLQAVDMALLKGDAHMYWMEELAGIEAHAAKIVGFSDVEEQRTQFDFLSQVLIKAIKVFGIPENTYYVQHCPMAFDNTGADWLSDQLEIRNPYFGDKMMKCGVNKDTITKDYRNPVQLQDRYEADRHAH